MDSVLKKVGALASVRDNSARADTLSHSENVNPNVSNSGLKPNSRSSAKKCAPVDRKHDQVALVSSSTNRNVQPRKFVVVKRKLRTAEGTTSAADSAVCQKCKEPVVKSKCPCVAYEKLRASQEEFFKDLGEGECGGSDTVTEKEVSNTETRGEFEDKKGVMVSNPDSGRVVHLVKEFEQLLKLGSSEEKDAEKDTKFPGCEQVSLSLFCPSDFTITSESLGLDPHRSYPLQRREKSNSNLTHATSSQRALQSRANSSRNIVMRCRKERKMKPTSQKPFMLRTEERGQYKMEEFMKKLQKMFEEEEKLRIPIAQGLPWTTDEPEKLVKPPVKETTKPIDVILHSDVRAVERSEFDHQVAVKMDLYEQYRMEMERRKKLQEEEEIHQLRKDLIPKAQPMPYFDRPFIPRRAMKHPTIPKEPKFYVPQQKKIKCCSCSEHSCAEQH